MPPQESPQPSTIRQKRSGQHDDSDSNNNDFVDSASSIISNNENVNENVNESTEGDNEPTTTTTPTQSSLDETTSSSSSSSNDTTTPEDIQISTTPKPALSPAEQRVYSRQDLQLFNLLTNPIWIFDITNKCMFWANQQGCDVWEAKDCEELCQRDYASDMSPTSERAMCAWLARFELGEKLPVTWTIHPDSGKHGPRTCEMLNSGIYVKSDDSDSDSEGHLCMLVHVKKVTSGKSREPQNVTTIRRTEMLRHFPIVARQFSIEGKLMDQNPQAHIIFGCPCNGPTSETEASPSSSKNKNDYDSEANTPPPPTQLYRHSSDGSKSSIQQQQHRRHHHHHDHVSAFLDRSSRSASSASAYLDRSCRSSGSSSGGFLDNSTRSNINMNMENICDFLAQFLDLDEGIQVLEEVRDGHDYSTETQQLTIQGPKWFTVNVRRIQDPVTSEPVIIYSARDITKVMESARLQAEKQNMKRNEFFAVMAHEIRTPLHQVVGFIELLASSPLNGEQKESVDMLQSSTHALMAIINDLLDFTKLEAGKMKLEIIPFEVRGVLNGSVAAVQPQVNERGLSILCNVDSNIPIKMLGDPNRLRQVVLNMLTNAVKFTKGGRIVVEGKRIEKKDENNDDKIIAVRFTVQDTGVGIPKDKCDRIFNPYQQADASVSRNYGGTGLGLAICKSLVQNSMGGTIGVESEVGKGTTFWFEIPFGTFVKRQTNPKVLVSDSIDGDSTHSVEELSTFKVLVAEDNKVNQKVVCKMLSRLGHEAKVVENGQEAVNEIVENQSSKRYDLVLMDWQMPVMDGIDATKEIRRKGYNTYELPIVGLTASIQGLDWSAIGMSDCLKKPIRIPDLKAALLKNVSKK